MDGDRDVRAGCRPSTAKTHDSVPLRIRPAPPPAGWDREVRCTARTTGVNPTIGGRTRSRGRLRLSQPRRAQDRGAATTVSVDDLRAKIREVPDFPKPGILFYDITTLLKEPDVVQGGHRPDDGALRRDEAWTSSWAWSRAASSSARPWPTSSAPAWCPCASWASCRPRRSASSTPSSTARTRWRSTRTPSRRASGCSSSTTCWPPAARSTGTIELVHRLGGEIVGLAFLVELLFLKGREKLHGQTVHSVIQY